jgi:regulator of nucleoside diphosphate kinase
MLKGEIYITKVDQEKLLSILSETGYLKAEDRALLKMLEDELARARIVDPKDIPPDIVTKNSKVRIEDMVTGEEDVYTVVFPGEYRCWRRWAQRYLGIGWGMLLNGRCPEVCGG